MCTGIQWKEESVQAGVSRRAPALFGPYALGKVGYERGGEGVG